MTKAGRYKQLLIKNNTYIVFLILFLVCASLSGTFCSVMNLQNIALQQSGPILVTIGMLFVVLTGGIDLSVGSVMALSASIAALLIRDYRMNFLLAILVASVIGALFGAFTGSLVAYLDFQGFVASLATMTIARGLAFVLTNGEPILVPIGTIDNLVSKSNHFPIILMAVVLIVLFYLIEKFTAWGRLVRATGSNVTAVRFAGIRVRRYTLSVYAVSGILAALAGIFVAARTSSGSATVGESQELDAIASCVIGGASLAGGKGSVVKAVFGALVLALIGNIMNLMAVPSYPQDIIKGIIIIIAVMLQVVTDKSKKS